MVLNAEVVLTPTMFQNTNGDRCIDQRAEQWCVVLQYDAARAPPLYVERILL